MTRFRIYNDNYSRFVVFLDIFAHYLYTSPRYSLTGREMVKAMTENFSASQVKPDILRSNRGIKYKNADVFF